MKKYSELFELRKARIEAQLDKHKAERDRHETAYEHHEGLGNGAKMKFHARKIKEHSKKIAELQTKWGRVHEEVIAESESAHKTHPLPNKHGDGRAMYDTHVGTIAVHRSSDGNYWADHGSHDHHETTAEKMRAHLKKHAALYMGWEHD